MTYIREDVRIACSSGWRRLVDNEVAMAASIEALIPNKPEYQHMANLHLRHALAVERMHRMVEKGLIPAYNYGTERWEP